MASLYLQYHIDRMISFRELTDGGGVAGFTKYISIGGKQVTAQFPQTVSGGFNIVSLTGVSLTPPHSSETGFSWGPVGSTYWSSLPVTIADGASLPLELVKTPGSVSLPEPPSIDSYGLSSFNWKQELFSTSKEKFVDYVETALKDFLEQKLTSLVGKQFAQSMLAVYEVDARLNDIALAATTQIDYVIKNFGRMSAAQGVDSSALVLDTALDKSIDGLANIAYKENPFYTKEDYKNFFKTVTISTTDFAQSQFKVSIGDSQYYRSAGSDIVFTGGGWNKFSGADGDDFAFGASGKDVFLDEGGSDRYFGGSGTDTVELSGPRSEFTVIQLSGGALQISRAGGSGLGWQSTNIDSAWSVERITFSDGTIAFDTAGTAGQGYRLYQAAFARVPDQPGLKHNIGLMDGGLSLTEMATAFLASAEFQQRYGTALSNSDYINALYRNVLHRDADAAGLQGWLLRLQDGSWNKTTILIGFSESQENVNATAAAVAGGIWLG